MKTINVTQVQLERRALEVAQRYLSSTQKAVGTENIRKLPILVYGVPRGGIPVAYLVIGALHKLGHERAQMTSSPGKADLIVDDIIDSGATQRRYYDVYPDVPFYAIIESSGEAWYVFPWENNTEGSFSDNVRRLLQFIGEDPDRGGLKETPDRVTKAWQFWCSGYDKDPKDVLKVFEDGAERCDEMVVVKDIPFYSHCEHHLAPIFGTATMGYIPDGRIVGLSKLNRLVDVYARRLQVQERLTNQIADALEDCLRPKGVGVVIKARHLCMESRGICQQGHHTITSALRGAVKEKPDARAEFLDLTK